MSKSEIKGLFFWRQNRWLPCGLNIKDTLWWYLMPGVTPNDVNHIIDEIKEHFGVEL
jgi:hypothetical protein